MTELPAWVYDLVTELTEQEETHPKLFGDYYTGLARYDWCPCNALKRVPSDVREKAEAIREYKRAQNSPPESESEVWIVRTTLPDGTLSHFTGMGLLTEETARTAAAQLDGKHGIRSVAVRQRISEVVDE